MLQLSKGMGYRIIEVFAGIPVHRDQILVTMNKYKIIFLKVQIFFRIVKHILLFVFCFAFFNLVFFHNIDLSIRF